MTFLQLLFEHAAYIPLSMPHTCPDLRRNFIPANELLVRRGVRWISDFTICIYGFAHCEFTRAHLSSVWVVKVRAYLKRVDSKGGACAYF